MHLLFYCISSLLFFFCSPFVIAAVAYLISNYLHSIISCTQLCAHHLLATFSWTKQRLHCKTVYFQQNMFTMFVCMYICLMSHFHVTIFVAICGDLPQPFALYDATNRLNFTAFLISMCECMYITTHAYLCGAVESGQPL